MAKDPTQSRIPRLDGQTRIPLPSISRKTHLIAPSRIGRAQLTAIIVPPSQQPSVGTAATNLTIIKHENSTSLMRNAQSDVALRETIVNKAKTIQSVCDNKSDKLCEQQQQQQQRYDIKQNLNFYNKLRKLDISPTIEECKMLIDETMNLEDIDYDQLPGVIVPPHDATRILDKNTFIIDNTNATLLNTKNVHPRICNLTQDVIKPINSSFDMDNTPANILNLTHAVESPILCDNSYFHKLHDDAECNIVGGANGGKILNSTMTERLLDITQTFPNVTDEDLLAKGYYKNGELIENLLHMTQNDVINGTIVCVGGDDSDSAVNKKSSENNATELCNKTTTKVITNDIKNKMKNGNNIPSTDKTIVLSHMERLIDVTPLDFQHVVNTQRNEVNATNLLYMTNIQNDEQNLYDTGDETLVGQGDQWDNLAKEERPNFMDIDEQEHNYNDDLNVTHVQNNNIKDAIVSDNEQQKEDNQNGDYEEQLNNINGANLENKNNVNNKQRFSFGLDLTDCTLDCSIELCDVSIGSSMHNPAKSPSTGFIKQNSFEMDESLGILTPDQMKEFLDSTTTTNLDLPLLHVNMKPGLDHKMGGLHQCRIDQTPSPEELPLDPVEVKTELIDIVMSAHQNLPQDINQMSLLYQELSQTDSDSKTDQITKSSTSKVSNSFITSVTSITSLDTGYQGDGEMSRPASRGADHSPSNGPKINKVMAAINHMDAHFLPNHQNHGGIGGVGVVNNWNPNPALPIQRRPDPMTDSDFFTESDADDIFHRGDRRAQVIDGQLYGPSLQAANVYINNPAAEDSCMESSGIFTDVENRGDDDMLHRSENENDLSPDTSTDTIRSNNSHCSQKQIKMNLNNSSSSALTMSTSSHPTSPPPLPPPPATSHQQNVQGQSCSTSKQLQQQQFESLQMSAAFNEKNISCCVANEANRSNVELVLNNICGENNFHNNITKNGEQQLHQQQQNLSGGVIVINNCDVSFGSNKSNLNDSLADKTVIAVCCSPTGKSNKFNISGGSGSNTSGCSAGNYTNNKIIGVTKPKKTSPSRKQNKNETNVALKNKQQEMSVKRNGIGKVVAKTAATNIIKKSPAAPNKWDAVMNKIAVNKTNKTKLNLSEVKSKVSSGVNINNSGASGVVSSASSVSSSRRSPGLIKTPPQLSTATASHSNSGNKKTTPGTVKRGRTFSKDSQQSSQSDISLNGGSPKTHTKPISASRSAKKRDVRTISSSPSDLGAPPTKTQTTPRCNTNITTSGNNNNGTINLQKRVSSGAITTNAANTLNINCGGQQQQQQQQQQQHVINNAITTTDTKGGSPPAKKSIVSRRPSSIVQQQTKSPLKDHNRLVGPPQSGAVAVTTVTTSNTINGKSNSITGSPKSGLLLRSSPQTTHSIRNVNNNNNVAGHHIGGEQHITTKTFGGKTMTTLPSTINNNKNSPKSSNKHTNIINNNNNNNNNINELATIVQQQQQPILPTATDLELIHANKGIEALGVLIQHLVFNLDAFSYPKVKRAYEHTLMQLLEARQQLDTTKVTCHNLEEELTEKETFYKCRETKLQEFHAEEISKVENCLNELERTTREQIATLETELTKQSDKASTKFNSYARECEIKISNYNEQLKLSKINENKLLERIKSLTTKENELREKVQASETEFGERVQAAANKERELIEKVNLLNRQLDDLKIKSEQKERELEEKLNIYIGEVSVLRQCRSSPERNGTSPTKSTSPSFTRTQGLQSEVESLRCVLELKQSDISDLRKQNQELQRIADELPAAQIKISGLESRIEDLQVQLRAKNEEEKELLSKNKTLQESYQHELKNRNRLSLHNEQLQYRLKQNSEKFSIALQEMSKSYHDQSGYLSVSMRSNNSFHESQDSISSNMNRSNGSDRLVDCFQMDDVSPPTSPIIKGVVEKSDSVSWVLEIEDESPEALASRMVRRAGSFRSNGIEKCTQSPVPKRQRHQVNALSQSASATSILRQTSVDSAIQKSPHAGSPIGNPRLRSKSVSVKPTEPKKIVRSNSGHNSNNRKMMEMTSPWKDQSLRGSSPPLNSTPTKRSCPVVNENGSLAVEELSQEKHCPPKPSVSIPRNRAASLGCQSQFIEQCQQQQQQQQKREKEGQHHRLNMSSSAATKHVNRKSGNVGNSEKSRGLITCDTSALTTNRPELCPQLPSLPSVQDLKQCQQPKESAGEAMVSGANSDDEASETASSDDSLPCDDSDRSSSSNSALHHLTLEDALMKKIVATLAANSNGSTSGACIDNSTPMEVSWSEDGDQYPSESIV